MDKIIEQVHLQITRNCNLRCSFCGQWGKKGFFSDQQGEEMTLLDWEKVILTLVDYRANTGISPFIMVWGGEPLVSPYFGQIVKMLHAENFKIGMVTNGVLIDKYLNLIDNAIDTVYVSIDGPPNLHNSIRGKGVFERVISNINRLTKSHPIVMSVITEPLLRQLPDFLDLLAETQIRELYLQDMIGLTSEEVQEYKLLMKDIFDTEANCINAWENNTEHLFHKELNEILARIDRKKYKFDIYHKFHNGQTNQFCLSPFRHVHVAWNGSVMFCTDFYDFSAGNVKDDSLDVLFQNAKSDMFREIIENGKCVTCKHCSWKDNKNYL